MNSKLEICNVLFFVHIKRNGMCYMVVSFISEKFVGVKGNASRWEVFTLRNAFVQCQFVI